MTYKIAICDDMEQDAQYIAAAVKKWAEQANVYAGYPCVPLCGGVLVRLCGAQGLRHPAAGYRDALHKRGRARQEGPPGKRSGSDYIYYRVSRFYGGGL